MSLTPVSDPTALSGAPSKVKVFRTASTQTVGSSEQGREGPGTVRVENPLNSNSKKERLWRKEKSFKRRAKRS